MKSLHKTQAQQEYPEIFTEEILKHIYNEGFEYRHAIYSYQENECDVWAFYKVAGYAFGDWPIMVYIRSNCIEVEVEYSYGGLSDAYTFNYSNDFESAYDAMVNRVFNCLGK